MMFKSQRSRVSLVRLSAVFRLQELFDNLDGSLEVGLVDVIFLPKMSIG